MKPYPYHIMAMHYKGNGTENGLEKAQSQRNETRYSTMERNFYILEKLNCYGSLRQGHALMTPAI